LEITANDSLVTIGGLQNVSAIGNSVEIRFNDALLNLDGLERMEHIESSIRVEDNGALEDVTGLHGLGSIGRDFKFSNNTSLGRSAIEYLAYDVIGADGVGGTISITGNGHD
jgi:hypothetical protein